MLKKDEAQSDTCCIKYLPLSNCLPTLLGEGSCHPCLDLKGLNRKGGNGAVGEEVTFWGDGSGASASTGLHLPMDQTCSKMSKQLQDTSQHPQRKAGWGGKRAYLESDYQGPCWVTLGSTFPLPTPVPACKIQSGVT